MRSNPRNSSTGHARKVPAPPPSQDRFVRLSTRCIPLLLACSLLAHTGCSEDEPAPTPLEGCVYNADCPPGEHCINGECGPPRVVADTANPPDALDGDTTTDPDTTGGGQDSSGSDSASTATAEFGAPCVTNSECASGWCVESIEGGYCSRPCDEGCPDGWTCKGVTNTGQDTVFICVRDKSYLCQPCAIDAHCGDVADKCLDIGGGQFCGRNCAAEECPTGYVCQEDQCIPENGSCDCGPATEGQVKGCASTNDFGTCFGQAVCEPTLGWIQCSAPVPSEELCDGADNDCDGTTDESLESTDCELSNEFGTCNGTQTCQGGAGWICTAPNPTAEACNGQDDDCDTAVDEDFLDTDGQYTTVAHCGACNNDCANKYANAAEVGCDVVSGAPTCVVLSCAEGFVLFNDVTCLSENALLCQPCQTDSDCFGPLSACVQVSATDPRTFCARDCTGASGFSPTCPEGYGCEEGLCLPNNDSCDCSTQNLGQTKTCFQENEFGTCFGEETCDETAGWTGCTAAIPTDEICDGIDNDCDGAIDEDIATGSPCETTNEIGTCQGVLVCLGTEGLACSAPEATDEICDGQDNNCDGQTDEDYATSTGNPPILKYGLDPAHCGACDYACPEVAHGTSGCNNTPTIPVCGVSACDEGYYKYLDIACLPVPTTGLCAPCGSNSDCAGPSDACLADTTGATACAQDCAGGSIYSTSETPCTGSTGEQDCCPTGYTCETTNEGLQCIPLSGTCSCIVDGLVGSCAVSNQEGKCTGVQTCELNGANPGWTACTAATPSEEVCDGADNDCDGLLDGQDDSLSLSETPTGDAQCSNGPGCNGSWQCLGGNWSCSAQTASPEVCDQLDNDCDGEKDEDFQIDGQYLSPDHCGGCGVACSVVIAHSVATSCELLDGNPTCIATECAPGHFPFAGGLSCPTLPDNLCQPCTNNQDCLVPGSECLDLGVENVCGRDCSATSPYGPDCPTGFACNEGQCTPTGNTCICGTSTVGLERSCPTGDCIGIQVCEEDNDVYAFTSCSAEGVIPEVCDGEDNDCDDQVDEGFVNDTGAYTTDEHCGGCYNNCLLLWTEAEHHATGACVNESCEIAACTTETLAGVSYEWVNVNEQAGDGCECRRVQGNLSEDLPDRVFLAAGTNTPAFPTVETAYEDANCDGVDGVIADALFVSSAAPAGGNGSLETPFPTIGAAIDAAPLAGKQFILVAGGAYEENITLTEGLKLHGGYAPDFLSRNIVTFVTEIRGQGPSQNAPGTINAIALNGDETVVSGFWITGADATGIGETSYAVYVRNSSSLFLANNRIVGGSGSPGSPGESGELGYGLLGPNGNQLEGNNGLNAGSCVSGNCNGKSKNGGQAGANPTCPGAAGHTGGGVVCPIYHTPAYTPADPSIDGGAGWSWTLDSGSFGSCTGHATEAGYPSNIKKMDGGDGENGNDGNDGLQGLGCTNALGTLLSSGLWAGGAGSQGTTAQNGNPGGAGGASGGIDSASASEMPPGVNATSNVNYKLGATGGGGGAAGCGGTGGSGGAPGGGSVAVFVAVSQALSAPPIIQGNRIERGLGGAGGTGGYGGAGGIGGDGGAGGNSQGFWIDFRAGDGGRGGRGGNGGGGGGGCGGASFGIAIIGQPGSWQLSYGDDNQFVLPNSVETGGLGGFAGPSGQINPNGQGLNGASANLLSAPAP